MPNSKCKTKKAIIKIELPFKEALARSTRQNFFRDLREGKCGLTDWVIKKKKYESEARILLLRDSQNKEPIAPDYEHFVLKAK